MPRHKYGAKPKNFPGRKNERRIGALARLNPEKPSRRGVRTRQEAEAEYLRLTNVIIPAEQARAIRTKKDRSGTGKLRRA